MNMFANPCYRPVNQLSWSQWSLLYSISLDMRTLNSSKGLALYYVAMGRICRYILSRMVVGVYNLQNHFIFILFKKGKHNTILIV